MFVSKVSSKWEVIFLTGVYLARICQGLSMSIIGPTLLYLASNAHTNVQNISTIFTTRALGVLFGAAASAYLIPKGKPLFSLAFAVLVLGLSFLIIPFTFSVPLLLLVFAIIGLVYGYLDAGQQALLLKLWGEKDSRSHIQGYHFAFTFGAIFGPIFARPFLMTGNLLRDDSAICPGSNNSDNEIKNLTNRVRQSNDTQQMYLHTFNPVGWSYIIPALLMVAVAVWYGFMAYMKTEQKIHNSRTCANLNAETRKQMNLANVWWLLLIAVVFYFFLIGSEHAYLNFIYSIAVCEFKMTQSDGSVLNTISWVGMTSGRLTGTALANYLLPGTIIAICSIVCFCSVLLMALFGHLFIITWITSFTYTFFVAPLFPAAVSWLSMIINISGKYMFIMYIGAGIASMTLMPVCGVIFQHYPKGVLFFSAGLIFLQCITYVGMIYVKRAFITKNQPQCKEQEQKSFLPQTQI